MSAADRLKGSSLNAGRVVSGWGESLRLLACLMPLGLGTACGDDPGSQSPVASQSQALGPERATPVAVTQSSTAWGGSAERAADGNTEGNYWYNSVTHTDWEYQPWWQADLGSVVHVSSVDVYNRTDCCADRLTNFNVAISHDGATWTTFNTPGQAGYPTSVPVNAQTRYVRVQLVGANYLSLAEVNIYKLGAIPASSSLEQALSGRVKPVSGVGPGGFIAAGIKGDVDVEHNGAAAYRFPLWVPDGIRDMEPTLGVEYNSHKAPGIFGPKWNLTGLSVITRCSQTMAADGIQRPTSLTIVPGEAAPAGDAFCLDTNRLVRTSGSPGGLGEFRTEMNPFQKIQVGQTGANGVLTFKVFQPDGRIFHYGQTAASRLSLHPAPPTEAYYAYYLDKIQDRYGNSILITYRSDYTYEAGTKKAQELVPATITWGGTGDNVGARSIRFTYTQPSTYNPDKYRRFVDGYTIVGGQRLAMLEMFGPEATGSTSLLKKYNFTYTTPTITGERLLETISECDANDVCKRPTTIGWESGSTEFLQAFPGSTVPFDRFLDPTLSTLPTVTGQNGVTVSLSNVYRRILPVDLNVDGRDDIVYRSEIAYGGYQCLGWVVRWNLGAGPNGATFSAPAMLPGSEQSDPNCYGDNTKFAYPGDLLFADYNLDDFPDFFNAVGIGGVKAPSWPGVPGPDWTSMTRYDYYEASCPVPGGLLSCHGWAGSQSFDDPTKVTATSPWLSVGDITGEGIPELIRPQAFAGTGLYWRTSSSEWGIVPAMTGSLKGYQVMDIDGDGTPEVIRDTGGHQSVVSSPTMNVTTNSIPPIHSTTPNPQYVHWFLDLNGDGLMDIAEVEATNPTSIITRMNTGKDFAPPVGTVLPLGSRIGQSWRDSHENGVRIVDFDLDGRQDLLLLDSGPEPGVASTRSTARVLKSDGLGGFVSQFSPTFPIGEFSDGAQAGKQVTNPVTPASHGYRTSVTLDLNGDGLTDVMQIEDGRPTMYVRQGKRPDMVTRIAEGHGRQIDIEYGPASDPEVHTRDLATCHGADPQRRLACLIKDRWLPKAITVSGWSLPGESVSETTRYKYTGGLFDRLGRGFLGFMRRDVFASTSKHTTIKYAASTLLNLNGNNYPPHTYPLALTPSEITVDVDTPHGPNTHQREVQTFTYFTTPTSWAPTTIRNTSRYMVLLQGITKKKYDCVGDGAGGCSGPLRVLSWQDDTYQYHPEYNYNEMGKPTIHSTFFRDENGIPLRTDMEVTTYAPFDSANWLMQTTEIQLKSWSFTVAPTDDVTRTFKFTPDLEPSPNTALLTGDAASVEIEPWVGSPERRLLTFGRDTRGRLTNLEDKEVATGVRRWTSSLYEDADGVYESTTFNSLGHRTRTWRHPGFGFVVEVDDPNNVASVKTYDTFGRLLDETAVSGASTSYAYADTADPILAGGTDMTILPEGRATRAIQVHTSSFGKETARTTPIDSGRTTTTRSRFDAFGRLVQKNVSGGPAGGESIFNTYIYQYDDLDRLLSECHLATDGLNHCKTNQYDGLSVAQSDESGRTITNISDPLGRPSIQRAAGMADATFTYGSFGLLRSQKLADGSGQTDFTYDVLGRRTSITRTDTGTRRTKYNAFNEVVETWKQKPDGTEVEKLTYGYDPLGRVVSVTGSGINRTLYYDRTHTGGVAQNAIGKLVDLFDDGSHVHVEYDEKGLVSSKSWMISMFAPLAHYGTMSFLYDSQGRLERQTFPKNVYGNYTALSLVHRYDPYTGGEASIADAENPSVPLWQVTERNDLGQITNEALNSHSGVSMSRTSNYYFATGQLSTSSLTGSEGQVAQLFYTYQPDALPNTVGMAGVGGSWTSQFDYDNLGRLTTWIPGQCCGGINVTLSYAYDSDGNLIGRSWGSPGGGENVSYGKGPGFEGGISRTVSTSGSGIQPWTDIYVFDRWGRMLGGPSVSLVYNANDEVVGAVGQSGQYEVNYHDGLGERIATQYGDGSYLVKLMGDEYEFRYDGTMFTTEERVRFRADGKVVGDVVRTSSTSKTTTFYLTDAMGSVLAEASTTGTVTARAKRDPYGNRLDSPDWPMLPREPGGADPDGSSRFGYAGHEREANWGLIDMKARFYNPRLGRFITPDSVIGNAADRRAYNAFAYAWNNPVAMVDPHGHDPDGVLRHTYVPGETRSPHRDGTDGVSGHDPQQPQHQPSAPAVVNAPVSAGTPMSVVTGSSVAGPTNGAQGTSGFDPTGPDDSPTEAQVIAALDLMIYAASLAFPPLAPLGIAWGGFKTGYYIGKEQYNDAAWAAAGVVGSVATQGQPVQGLIMKETNIIMKEASGDHTIDPDTYQNQEDGQAAGEAAAQAARTAGPGAKSGAEGASGTDRGAGGGGSQPSSSSQGGGSGGGGPTGSEGTTGHGCGPCTGMR